jgi:DNA-binding PadR family transcriptional regulator
LDRAGYPDIVQRRQSIAWPGRGHVDTAAPIRYYVAMRHVVDDNAAMDSAPVTEPVLLILLSLADSPRHGYALLKDIEAMSSGRVRLSTGTLYGALHRLLESDWIERFESADTARDKRCYRLTAQGRRVLALEFKRLKQLTRLAGARLRASEA